MNSHHTLNLSADGAQRLAAYANPFLAELQDLASRFPKDRAGYRLNELGEDCELFGADGQVTSIATQLSGKPMRAVRCVLFNKTADCNWSLDWHQDRTICVRDRVDMPGFGPWTVKQGLHHIAPPIGILERMITLRLHLDDVPHDNAPLKVALGSHRIGRIAEREIEAVVEQHEIFTCLAQAGDIWAYSTPILHASAASSGHAQRRVLQVDYSPDELPGELEWLGV